MMNGQYILDENYQCVYDLPIPKDSLRQAFHFFQDKPYLCAYFGKDCMYYYCSNAKEIEKIESTTWVPQRIETPDLKSLLQQDIYQICPYFSQDLDELFLKKVDHLKLERWIDFFADMVPVEGEKPQGIKKVFELWGLEKEYIAFGDGGNDLAMLQEASLGIAMGNANETVKKAADFVTKEAKEEGICWALEQLGILEK